MATYKSDKVTNKAYYPSAAPHSARETYTVATKTVIPVADTLAAGDLLHLAVLPANCVPCDFKALVDDLDSDATPAVVFSVGILNAAGDDLVPSSLLVSLSTAGQAGGAVAIDEVGCIWSPEVWLAEATCPGYDASNNDVSATAEKVVAMKITTAADDVPPAEATIHASLSYRSVEMTDKPA